MINKLKIVGPEGQEWIERILFVDGEDSFSEELVGLSVVGRVVNYRDGLDEVMRVTEHFAARLGRQLSVLDVSHPDPERGRFLTLGNYRMQAGAETLAVVGDIPNVVQRRQAAQDYYTARTLGVPIYARIRAQMNGERWAYDRILVPVRTRELSLLVSAFWLHSAVKPK